MSKIEKINAILISMQERYEEEGVEGDFDDARRYYLNDASMVEIDTDYQKWCKQM
jgi:hypothetical protein